MSNVARILTLLKMAGGKPLETDEVKIRERTHVEKFDHSGDTPKLIEYLIVEDGRVVHRETPGDATTKEE
ncbi:MAG: hypothetical protein ACE5JD_18255 [Candidatus Methylomirabilia bacterium]